MTQHEPNSQLLDIFSRYFDSGEIQELCFKLDIPFEDIPGDRFTTKAIALIEYTQRHNKFDEMINLMREMRPHVQMDFTSSDSLLKTVPLEETDQIKSSKPASVHIKDNRTGVFFEGTGSTTINGDVVGIKNINQSPDSN